MAVQIGPPWSPLGNRSSLDSRSCGLPIYPRLTAGCIQVSMSPEEWVEGAKLVPACEELGIRFTKEAPNISTWTSDLKFHEKVQRYALKLLKHIRGM